MRRSRLLGAVVGATLLAGSGQAAEIFDSFDPGGTFHPQFNIVAAAGHQDPFSSHAIRLAVQFTVSGASKHLTSITLPINFQGDDPGTLRVRLTEDVGGYPGTTLEVLSENEAVWPYFSNPFDTKTTLVSSVRPLLVQGASYWIVTELTLFPASWADYRWFTSVSGVQVPILQQQENTGVLPSDPWTDATSSSVRVAFRVEGADEEPVVPCDIELDDATYSIGDTVTASVLRLANPSAGDLGIEWKVWLETAYGDYPIVNAGADGTVILPGGFDYDFGPTTLFTVVEGFPRGSYGVHCRILDPITGQTRYLDENPFVIE